MSGQAEFCMRTLIASMGTASLALLVSLTALAQPPHAIHVVDSATGRGVPLVKLRTNGVDYYTDSNGYLAFDDPTTLGESLTFSFSSYGFAGLQTVLQTTPGATSNVTVQRQQRAERIYRVTGKGIYRDTVALGLPAPIAQPLINANVKGQDSVQATIYNDQIHWFWGDTLYDIGFGNFRVAGAVSPLPEAGGLAPSVGVNLDYYVSADGSAKQMMPVSQSGPIWIDGLFTIPDHTGTPKMLSHYSRRSLTDPLGTHIEHGLARFDDAEAIFERFKIYATDAPITAVGHAFEHTVDDQEYLYFALSYPNVRVRRTWNAVVDITQWEAYTPLLPNTRYNPADPPLELDAEGKPVYGWKKNTDPLSSEMLEEMVQNGHLERSDSPFRMQDFETGEIVRLHRASVAWNDYRNSWVMIGNEFFGDSFLGEVWFAEAPTPEGPWENAVKVATHHQGSENYTLYNPKHHPFFDEAGGRIIYFEGTYAETFSGNPTPTPLYDYNQMMFRLDLSTIPALFPRLVGDYNLDGVVDATDYLVWRNTLGSTADLRANGDNEGASWAVIDAADYLAWKNNFGATLPMGRGGIVNLPEPIAAVSTLLASGLWPWRPRRDRDREC